MTLQGSRLGAIEATSQASVRDPFRLFPGGAISWELKASDYPIGLDAAWMTPDTLEYNSAVCPSGSATPCWTRRGDCEALPISTGSGYLNHTSVISEAKSAACGDIRDLLFAIDVWEGHMPALSFTYAPGFSGGDGFEMEVWPHPNCSWNVWSFPDPGDAMGNQAGKDRLRVENDGSCRGSGIAHELGHALGLWHEQGRHDRDDFLTVDNSELSVGDEIQNWKCCSFTDIGPFDFDSMMLYNSYTGMKSRTYYSSDPGMGPINATCVKADPTSTVGCGVSSADFVEFDVQDLFQGAGFQREFFGSWEIEILVDSSCFSSFMITTTSDDDLIARVPVRDIGPATVPASRFSDDSCYLLRRRGKSGKPSLQRKWLDWTVSYTGAIDASFQKRTIGAARAIAAGDASGVSHQYSQFNLDASPASAGESHGALIASGDFDGDGVQDVAIASPGDAGGGAVNIYRGVFGANDTGEVEFDKWQVLLGTQAASLAVGDFDGDKYDDLAIGRVLPGSSAGEVVIHSRDHRQMLGRKTVLSLAGGVDGAGPGADWPASPGNEEFGAALAVHDFNGDERDDLLVGSPGSPAAVVNFDAARNDPASPPGDWPAAYQQTGAVYTFYGEEDGWDSSGNRNPLLSVEHSLLDPYLSDLRGSQSGGRFGQAIEVTDLTDDGTVEVPIGASHGFTLLNTGTTWSPVWETQGNHTPFPTERRGLVYSFPRVLHHVPPNPYTYDSHTQHGHADAEYGHTIAASSSAVFVGAPGASNEGKADVGMVYEYRYPEASSLGVPSVTLTRNDFSGCGPMEGDRFGETMAVGLLGDATSESEHLAVGGPSRNVGCLPFLTASEGGGGVYLYDLAPWATPDIHLEVGTGGSGPSTPGPSSLNEAFGSSLAFQPRNKKCFVWGAQSTASIYDCGQLELWVGSPAFNHPQSPNPESDAAFRLEWTGVGPATWVQHVQD